MLSVDRVFAKVCCASLRSGDKQLLIITRNSLDTKQQSRSPFCNVYSFRSSINDKSRCPDAKSEALSHRQMHTQGGRCAMQMNCLHRGSTLLNKSARSHRAGITHTTEHDTNVGPNNRTVTDRRFCLLMSSVTNPRTFV